MLINNLQIDAELLPSARAVGHQQQQFGISTLLMMPDAGQSFNQAEASLQATSRAPSLHGVTSGPALSNTKHAFPSSSGALPQAAQAVDDCLPYGSFTQSAGLAPGCSDMHRGPSPSRRGVAFAGSDTHAPAPTPNLPANGPSVRKSALKRPLSRGQTELSVPTSMDDLDADEPPALVTQLGRSWNVVQRLNPAFQHSSPKLARLTAPELVGKRLQAGILIIISAFIAA